MLRDLVTLTNVEPKFWASVFNVAPEQFYDWMSGNRHIPKYILPELASVFGVQPSDIEKNQFEGGELQPAIWYKLRSTQSISSTADLEMVGMVRKLCFNVGELQSFLGRTTGAYEGVFQRVRSGVDKAAPVISQAREAARIFRAEMGWETGSGVIGDFIRPALRRIGIVIVESPVSDSRIEGCSFRVKSAHDIACVFANSYQSTWFRRNSVILHEVSHGIFDLEGEPVSVDYKQETSDDINERRANLFAQECLVPKAVLTYLVNRFGIHWERLSAEKLAVLVAESKAEQRLVLRAALSHKMITPDQHDEYIKLDCAADLKRFSSHALTTREFLATVPHDQHKWFFQDRFVKIGNRGLLLPVGFLKVVIELLSTDRITIDKAAELTMMDRYTFKERFRLMLPEAA